MSVFDLLFLCGAAATLLTLGYAAFRWSRAGAILRLLGLCIAGYFTIVIVVSIVAPRRILAEGAPECFDDMCITVEGAIHDANAWSVALRLSSRARRATQRENNLSVYLTDASGRRYDPVVRPNDVPLNSRLGPGESVQAIRVIPAPPNLENPGLVVTHEGGFPIGWLIIGYDTWFRKPAMVRLR